MGIWPMDQHEHILEKSSQLFMRYGIKSISMDDLARELGISKKTLYQFVENKADLIEQVFQRKITEEQQAMARFRESSTDAIEEILKIAKHVIGVLRQLSPTTMYDLQKYYQQIWKKVEGLQKLHIYGIILNNLRWGMDQGLYRQDMNPEIVAKLYVAKTSFVADEDLFPASDYKLEDLFREHNNYHVYGSAAPKGLKLLEAHLEEELNQAK